MQTIEWACVVIGGLLILTALLTNIFKINLWGAIVEGQSHWGQKIVALPIGFLFIIAGVVIHALGMYSAYDSQRNSNFSSSRQESSLVGGTSSVAPSGISGKSIRGRIGTNKILMSFDESNGRISGKYAYVGRSGSLQIEGSGDAVGSATLEEYDSNRNVTGQIHWENVSRTDNVILLKGTWSSPDGNKSLPFQLDPINN